MKPTKHAPHIGTPPHPFVRELVESHIKTQLYVGLVTKHPDGRTVKIVDGAFWRNGRLSNFWDWREVKPNGRLGKVESGYGW
jgi:hypothetical protein